MLQTSAEVAGMLVHAGSDSTLEAHSLSSSSPEAQPAAPDVDVSDSEAGDDLLSFLADLKNKYGLEDAGFTLQSTAGPGAPADSQGQLQVNVGVVSGAPMPGSSPPPTLPLLPHLENHQGTDVCDSEASATQTSAQSEPGEGLEQHASCESHSELDDELASAPQPPWWQTAVPLENPCPHDASAAQAATQDDAAETPAVRWEEADGCIAQLEAELRELEELRLAAAHEPQADHPAAAAEPSSTSRPDQPSEASPPHGRAQPSAWVQQPLPWHGLHSLLVRRGFPGLFGSADPSSQPQPDQAALYSALQSLLHENARCSAHQQRLVEAAREASRRESALVSSFAAAAKKKAGELAKWKRLAMESQVAAQHAQHSGQRCKGTGDQIAAEARQLEALVSRQQHALSIKDGELARLKQALADVRERDERRQLADRSAYDRLRRGYAAAKAAETPGAAAAEMRAASRQLKPWDLMRIFEAERSNLQEAAAAAAAEAAIARAKLARAQEGLHAAGLQCDQYDSIEGEARAAARQAAVAEQQAAALAEEVEALRRELAHRPTQAQMDTLRRQADIMERQLAKAAAEKAAGKAREANSRPRPRPLSTREAIQRDRNMQRLGLHSVEDLPKPVLVEVVQDACALLECRQPLELCSAVRPLQDLAALVPRIKRFVGDVCAAVFQRGLAHVPEVLRQDNPGDVPAVLAAWIAELSELTEMRGVMRALMRQLSSRVTVQPADPPPTAAEVVPLVASLVDLERRVFHSQEVIEAAEAAIAAQPDLLLHRIVLQFQRLFECRGLDGVLPAMNKLYLAHTEAQTFLTALRAAVGLDPGASLEACTNRLDQLLRDSRVELASMLPASERGAAAPALPARSTAVVVEVDTQRRGLQEAARVAVERMASRRGWPQVQIFVPAPRNSTEDREQ